MRCKFGNHFHLAKKGKDTCEYHGLSAKDKCLHKYAYTEERAYLAAQNAGFSAYECPHCGDWHITSQTRK